MEMTDSLQRTTMSAQEATDATATKEIPSGEEKFGIRVVKQLERCPEGLWDLHPRRHLQLKCQGLDHLDLSWPYSEQGTGPGDLRGSFKNKLLSERR